MSELESPRFCHYLTEENIICGTRSSTAQEVIEELAKLIEKNVSGFDAAKIVHEVILREQVMPTVVAKGLAVPHARMEETDRMIVALATSEKGIVFDDSKEPVKVVIMMLTPAGDPGIHLQVLSALAMEFANCETVGKVASLNNPQAIMKFFHGSEQEIPEFLRAKDVMETEPVTLFEHNTLAEAIKIFATSKEEELPVIDEDRELRGVVSLTDLFKLGLPEHLLWLEDLSSVYRFQPFAEVLATSDETKVADIMREEIITVNQEIPAVQLAKQFLVHKVNKLIVADSSNKLAGIVNLKVLAAKLFWE